MKLMLGGRRVEIGSKIKKSRIDAKLTQEQAAEALGISRQTISNWENEKSYPDVNSLILLSEVFQTSIDKLMEGDIEIMKEKINEQEIKKLNYYGNIFCVHLAITILSAVPLFFWLEQLAFIPFGILFVITIYWALKVEKVKKDNDIQTYKEIVAFLEGKRLDEIQKQREIGKRPYQNVLKGIVAGIVTIVVCFLIGLLFHLLGN